MYDSKAVLYRVFNLGEKTKTLSIKEKPIYNIYKYMFRWLKTRLGTYANVCFVNLLDQFLNEAKFRYGSYHDGLEGGALTTDGIHLNQEGSDVYTKYLAPLFEI